MIISEIGGYFELNPELISGTSYNLNNTKFTKFLSSGRESLRYALKDINITKSNKVALVPSFTCETVLKEFINEGFELKFYNYNKDLTLRNSQINDLIRINTPDVIIIQPLFGFQNIITDEKINFHPIIIDNTQNIYTTSDFGTIEFDYEIASLRKWMPLVDGAYIKKTKDILNDFEIVDIDYESLNKGKMSQILRFKYLSDGIGNKQEFLELKKEFDRYLINKNNFTHMSIISKIIFENCDKRNLIEKRKKNYYNLLEYDWSKFGDVIFTDLNDDEVPLYFPFFINKIKREVFLSELYNHRIYAPIIWPKSKNITDNDITNDTDYIYNNIVAFPIDQRYDDNHIERIKIVLDDIKRSIL